MLVLCLWLFGFWSSWLWHCFVFCVDIGTCCHLLQGRRVGHVSEDKLELQASQLKTVALGRIVSHWLAENCPSYPLYVPSFPITLILLCWRWRQKVHPKMLYQTTQHHIPDNLNCQQDHHGNLKFYSYTYLISKRCWWNTLHAGLYMSRNKLRFVAVSNKCSTMSLNSNSVMSFCVLGLSESFTSSSSSSFWLPNLCSTYLKTWTQK